jgi:hypothetical protein
MWNYLKASFFFWFGLIFAAVGTPFLLASIYELNVERDIAEHGIRTEATLVEKGHTTSRRGDSNYWLTYVFQDQQGREQIRRAQVHWEQWRSFQDGDKMTVRYVPDSPQRNRLSDPMIDEPWWVLPFVFSILGIVFGGFGWTFIVILLRKVRRELHLLRTGTITVGEITGFDTDPQVTINGRHPCYLKYRYEVAGHRYHGQSPDLPLRIEGKWNNGDKITVIYDPRSPEQSEPDIFDVRGER